MGTLYIDVDGGKQAVLAYISVGVVFVQFIGIVLFHAVQKVKTLVQRLVPNKEVVRENNLHRGVNVVKTLVKRLAPINEVVRENNPDRGVRVAPPDRISYSIQLRESLLD